MENNKLMLIFEGIDGCGKGTIINLLKEELTKNKYRGIDLRIMQLGYEEITSQRPEFLVSCEPTYYKSGKKIRDFLKKVTDYDSEKKKELAEMFANDRYFLYTQILKPFFNHKYSKMVIQERSVISSLVYQGLEFETLPENQVALNFAKLIPTVVFILDVDPKIAIERLEKRDYKKDDACFEKYEFLNRTREKYLNQEFLDHLKSYGFNIHIIDNNKSAEETYKKIEEILKERNIL